MPQVPPAELIAKAQAKAKRNKWQDAYALQVRQAGLPKPTPEYEIIPRRKLRWDFCFPECLIAIEINGSIWQKGGHNTGTGLLRDYEKGNLANLRGWCCLTFTPEDIKDGTALDLTKQALQLFPPF